MDATVRILGLSFIFVCWNLWRNYREFGAPSKRVFLVNGLFGFMLFTDGLLGIVNLYSQVSKNHWNLKSIFAAHGFVPAWLNGVTCLILCVFNVWLFFLGVRLFKRMWKVRESFLAFLPWLFVGWGLDVLRICFMRGSFDRGFYVSLGVGLGGGMLLCLGMFAFYNSKGAVELCEYPYRKATSSKSSHRGRR